MLLGILAHALIHHSNPSINPPLAHMYICGATADPMKGQAYDKMMPHYKCRADRKLVGPEYDSMVCLCICVCVCV